ncbi:McrB family protein [Vagococcus salmoninarum]|uniref:McrB family protein n=1 Tax=Vagococcus salmoninarum TaxID=2739 RepID=UPI001882B7B1|nr:AAA family ATPase [Vagococcus salmoninarum]MBE9389548.1 AAA family ATPase [Vagococcus salmoninarum]
MNDDLSISEEQSDYLKFKKILEYFIHILRANNYNHPEQFNGDEPKSGQGYKEHAIKKSYEGFNFFSNGQTMDVNISGGFQLYSKTNYINWTGTGYNVRAKWNGQKDDITGIQLYDNYTDSFIGPVLELGSLGLNNQETVNLVLKKFYDDFAYLLSQTRGEKNMRITSFSEKLRLNYNLIFRGAPGTGKTYLAKQIAVELVSEGVTNNYNELSESQKQQIEFVQFHPSYDYTDFVEGLRPVIVNGQVSFERKDGLFMEFCQRAQEKQITSNDVTIESIWKNFIEDEVAEGTLKINNYTFKKNGNNNITYKVPGGSTGSMTLTNVKDFIETNKWSEKNDHATYKRPIYDKYIAPRLPNIKIEDNNVKNYVFIIDEINRGEISKIFGELFFSLDPEYRGEVGAVSTQYSNLQEETAKKFFIPKNVYIIGTMNDIDRSVDMFDFAMRRRFSFEEITAADSQEWLEKREVKNRMNRLNQAIVDKEIGDLSTDYQIGASYFKLLDKEKITAQELWNSKLAPLLKDYFRGDSQLTGKMIKMKNKYFEGESDALKTY